MNYAKQYQELHNASPKLYSGQLDNGQVSDIRHLVYRHKPLRLLDYGSGKGYQYLRDRIHDTWGGILPVCYDPGVQPLSRRPQGPFDGVICTDVMEHIQEQDVAVVIADIFGFLRPCGFAYFYICTRASSRLLPDGRGVHLTVKPPGFWEPHLDYYRDNFFDVVSTYGN